jgi:hypothetical protein
MFYSTGSSCVTFLGEILDFVIVEFTFIKKDRISYFDLSTVIRDPRPMLYDFLWL